MNRGHRRWHRLIWALLAPALALLLLVTWWARGVPAAPADLPSALVNAVGEPL